MSSGAASGGDDSPARLIEVPTYSQAQVIGQLLEAHGIPTIIKKAKSPRFGLFKVTFGLHQGACEILVPRALLGRATEQLEESRRAGEALSEWDEDSDFEIPDS